MGLTKAAKSIESIHKGELSGLAGEQRFDLALFLALGWLRTPAAQKRTELLMEAGITTTMRISALNEERFNKTLDGVEGKTGEKIDNRKSLRDFILGGNYRIGVGRQASLQMLAANLLEIAESINSMQWIVCLPEKKGSFLLSDINFVIEQVQEPPKGLGSGGLLTPGTQSMSILTNKACVVLKPNPGEVSFTKVNKKFIKSSNEIYAIRSSRFVLSHSMSLLKRVVKRAKIDKIAPFLPEIEVYSGPENKVFKYKAEL